MSLFVHRSNSKCTAVLWFQDSLHNTHLLPYHDHVSTPVVMQHYLHSEAPSGLSPPSPDSFTGNLQIFPKLGMNSLPLQDVSCSFFCVHHYEHGSVSSICFVQNWCFVFYLETYLKKSIDTCKASHVSHDISRLAPPLPFWMYLFFKSRFSGL